MQTLRHIVALLLAVTVLAGCKRTPSDAIIKADQQRADVQVAAARIPSEETIKADLLGLQVGEGRYSWKFQSLSEFTEFLVTNKVTQGDVIEYSAIAKLKGVSGMEAAVDLRVVYRKEGGVWKLANVRDAGALKDSLRGTPPDPSDIQKIMSLNATQPSKGLIKVVRVTSKGGHFDENSSKIAYRMDVSVTLEFTGNCAYNGFVADPDNGESFFNRNKGRKGETKSFDVTVTAKKELGEKRWEFYWNF